MTDSQVAGFPAAVGLTHLRVYDTAAPDGVTGGSPHVHLASAEAYIPIAGEGEVQTLSASGERTYPLHKGNIVWFEPGVIHRLINADGELELLVIMQNAGLPEAGDAVFTFPDDIMADKRRYLNAASLGVAAGEDRIVAALRRRDLAVAGFDELARACRAGDQRPLHTFLDRATTLKRTLVPEWESLVEEGPVHATRTTRQRLSEVDQGDIAGLLSGQVRSGSSDTSRPGIGMCGLLGAYAPND